MTTAIKPGPRHADTVRERPAYDRARDLPRLVPLWPSEITDQSCEGRLKLIARLERALRGERRRGVAGHWSYDLARHAELLAALKEERAALKS